MSCKIISHCHHGRARGGDASAPPSVPATVIGGHLSPWGGEDKAVAQRPFAVLIHFDELYPLPHIRSLGRLAVIQAPARYCQDGIIFEPDASFRSLPQAAMQNAV